MSSTTQYTQEVVEGARDHVDGIIAQALPEHLSDKLGDLQYKCTLHKCTQSCGEV